MSAQPRACSSEHCGVRHAGVSPTLARMQLPRSAEAKTLPPGLSEQPGPLFHEHHPGGFSHLPSTKELSLHQGVPLKIPLAGWHGMRRVTGEGSGG